MSNICVSTFMRVRDKFTRFTHAMQIKLSTLLSPLKLFSFQVHCSFLYFSQNCSHDDLLNVSYFSLNHASNLSLINAIFLFIFFVTEIQIDEHYTRILTAHAHCLVLFSLGCFIVFYLYSSFFSFSLV